jgi:hypothetical protein
MGRNTQHFLAGAGVATEESTYTCAECGYTSTNRKHFKNHEDGKTCATGHYERDGELKRAKNPYASR